MLGVVLALIGLPLLLALGESVAFYGANRSDASFVSSGEQREYNVHVPPGHDRAKPTPLVISLHGAAMWGAAQAVTSEWNRVADANGFIVVYPTGVNSNGPRIWREDQSAGLAKDVRFIADLIDTLRAAYNVDPERIYANGLSNGGGMSFALSCLMPDRLAAVGMVGAAQLVPFAWCPDHHAMPMIDFHGTADSAAPYGGGKTWVAPKPFPNVRSFAAQWAARNRCAPTPSDTTITTDVTRRAYIHCDQDASVVLYTIQGGGHTWPGGGYLPEWFAGRTTQSIDASSLMWAFFREHRRTALQSESPATSRGRPLSRNSTGVTR